MVYKLFLYGHILAGFVALLSGGLAFSVPKGRQLHRRSGQVFVGGMLVVGLTAFVMCLLKVNPFLFSVALFSTYLTLTGYRSLHYPKTIAPRQLAPDWAIWITTLTLGTGFTAYSFWQKGVQLAGLQLVLLVFMALLALLLVLDWKLLRKPGSFTKTRLLQRHISRMGGAYISTITAFVVTNVQTDPVYLAWLLPSLLGAPLIARFQWLYRSKKNAAKQAV